MKNSTIVKYIIINLNIVVEWISLEKNINTKRFNRQTDKEHCENK